MFLPAKVPGVNGLEIATVANSRKSKVVSGSRRQLTTKRSVASMPAAMICGSPAATAGAGAVHASAASVAITAAQPRRRPGSVVRAAGA